MCKFRVPTGPEPNFRGLPNTPITHGETALTAKRRGTLRELARIANDVSVSKRLYEDLSRPRLEPT